jgi:hypothetical protein
MEGSFMDIRSVTLQVTFIVVINNSKNMLELGLISEKGILDFPHTTLSTTTFLGNITVEKEVHKYIKSHLIKKDAPYTITFKMALGSNKNHAVKVSLTLDEKSYNPKMMSAYTFDKILSKNPSSQVKAVLAEYLKKTKK